MPPFGGAQHGHDISQEVFVSRFATPPDNAETRIGAANRTVQPASTAYSSPYLCLILFVLSFWSMRGFNLLPGFTLSNYTEGITSSLYQTVLIRTLVVGFSTACIVVPIAYVLSYLMRFVFVERAQLIFHLIVGSMFSGYLVRIYAWRTILGKDGILNSILLQLGVIEEPLRFIIFSHWAGGNNPGRPPDTAGLAAHLFLDVQRFERAS